VARVKTQEIPPLVKLLCEDRRYKLEGYQFVRMGLTYAQEVLGLGEEAANSPPRGKGTGSSQRGKSAAAAARPSEDDDSDLSPRKPRHVRGQDLCLALKRLGQEQFGLMAKLVLSGWGIHSTSDFGEIVYNLIKIGEMSKSEGDRREDFDDVYDFDQSFVRDFAITKED
jgi:uncharacterized repeat protein (TIGR04138 family)